MRPAFLPVTSARVTFASADSARAQAAPAAPVMEVVTFRLTPATSPAAFLDRARATEAVVVAQPGSIRRSLLCDDSGMWTDMIVWRSLAEAQAAAQVVMADPGFGPFATAIDMSTLQLRHTPILWQMGD